MYIFHSSLHKESCATLLPSQQFLGWNWRHTKQRNLLMCYNWSLMDLHSRIAISGSFPGVLTWNKNIMLFAIWVCSNLKIWLTLIMLADAVSFQELCRKNGHKLKQNKPSTQSRSSSNNSATIDIYFIFFTVWHDTTYLLHSKRTNLGVGRVTEIY